MEERCVGGLISMKKTGLSWFRGSITNIIAKSIAPIPPTWASVVVYCGMTVNWVGGKHSLRIVRVRTCPLSSPCPIDERISLQYVMVRFTKSSHATIGSVIWRLFGLRECNEVILSTLHLFQEFGWSRSVMHDRMMCLQLGWYRSSATSKMPGGGFGYSK